MLACILFVQSSIVHAERNIESTSGRENTFGEPISLPVIWSSFSEAMEP